MLGISTRTAYVYLCCIGQQTGSGQKALFATDALSACQYRSFAPNAKTLPGKDRFSMSHLALPERLCCAAVLVRVPGKGLRGAGSEG